MTAKEKKEIQGKIPKLKEALRVAEEKGNPKGIAIAKEMLSYAEDPSISGAYVMLANIEGIISAPDMSDLQSGGTVGDVNCAPKGEEYVFDVIKNMVNE